MLPRILVLFFLITALIVAVSTRPPSCNRKYVIMMDAGSTKTRSYLYSFERDSSNILQLMNTEAGIKTTALSHYANKRDQWAKLRSQLRIHATTFEDKLPRECVSTTPIILMATAGVRALPDQKADRLLKEVRDVFSKTKFLFKSEYVGILSGNDEGAFAWLGANYLNANLREYPDTRNFVGTLDMGGGSTQISFLPNYPEKLSKVDDFRIGEDNYKLYTKSYLGFGLQAMRMRFFNVSERCKAGECGEVVYKSSCIHAHYFSSIQFGQSRYSVRGSDIPDSQRFCQCYTQAYGFIQPIVNIRNSFTEKTFLTIAGYYFIFSNIRKLEHEDTTEPFTVTLRDILIQTVDICEKPHSSDTPGRLFVPFLCMDMSYIFALLHNGYGFELDDSFLVTQKLTNQQVNWAIGYSVKIAYSM